MELLKVFDEQLVLRSEESNGLAVFGLVLYQLLLQLEDQLHLLLHFRFQLQLLPVQPRLLGAVRGVLDPRFVQLIANVLVLERVDCDWH